jgi:acyl-CoA thioesterase FadM
MSGWTIVLDLEEESVDYLGHVTAAAHLAMFEESRARWLMTIMDADEPSFVLVRQELDYRRELLLSAGRVSVSVTAVGLGRSSLEIVEAIRSLAGVHTESRAVLVRWDRARRCSMHFPPVERGRIEQQMSPR